MDKPKTVKQETEFKHWYYKYGDGQNKKHL